MGYCVNEMIEEVKDVQDSIRIFSARCDGMRDDLVLYEAERLVEDIRRMIDTKKDVNEELGFKFF